MPEMDALDTHFNNLYYEFVEKGGLDREQKCVRSEDYERISMQLDKTVPQSCVHGATKVTCSTCWFEGYSAQS
jgi:hypothetical protein